MKDKLRQLTLSSRPVSWVNTAFPFAAAYLVTASEINTVLLILGVVYFLIPYNLLMYGINDVFDYESDLRNPRKVGAEGIRLRPALHRLTLISAAALNLPFVIALCLLSSWQAAAVLAAVLFFVVAYSAPLLRFKERPFLDSLTSSIHFVGPMVFGLVAADADLAVAWPYILAFLLWGMASHAFGAVQDVIADRAAHIGSVATVIGARWTVRLALLAYLASTAILCAQAVWPAVVTGMFLLVYAANVLPYLHIKDAEAEAANAGWRRFMYLNYATGAVVTNCLILWFR